jgi:hypothetical protein
MMKKAVLFVIVGIVAMFFIALPHFVVEARLLNSAQWWPENVVPLRPFTFANGVNSSVWNNSMVQGVQAWNSVSNMTGGFIAINSAWSPNDVRVELNCSQGRLGLFEPLASDTHLERFAVRMFHNQIMNYVISHSPGVTADPVILAAIIRSIMAHEMGHVLGLADNPVGVSPSGTLMSHFRNRVQISSPQAFDIQSAALRFSILPFSSNVSCWMSECISIDEPFVPFDPRVHFSDYLLHANEVRAVMGQFPMSNSFEHLEARADSVIRAIAIARRVELMREGSWDDARYSPHTIYTFVVVESYSGHYSIGDYVEVFQSGGAFEGVVLLSHDYVPFDIYQEYVLFLGSCTEYDVSRGFNWLLSPYQGAFIYDQGVRNFSSRLRSVRSVDLFELTYLDLADLAHRSR